MDSISFKNHVKEFTSDRHYIMNGIKEEQYSTNDDRLWNFKVSADIIQAWFEAGNRENAVITQQDVAFMFMTKHIVSLIKGIATNNINRENLIDINNYIDIIEAMEHEKEESVSESN